MAYTTFGEAKKWVEPGYGDCAPEVTAEVVNEIRHEFFNWYDRLPLFLDAVECYRVHRFPLNCDDCSQQYLGITLARDAQQVEALWFNGYPVALQSSWREFQTGIAPECACGLDKYDLAGSFATALDIWPLSPKRIQVRALKKADVGKSVTVTGTDVLGRKGPHTFVLSMDPVMSDIALRAIAPGGVLKDITVGRVVLSDEDGKMLSMYEPDERSPSYRRIKITGLPDSCSVVNVRASRRFFPLYGDNDTVETDNKPAFDAMARYLRLYRKADKSRDDLAAEKDFLAKAFQMMIGDKSRDLGRGTQAEMVIVTPNFGGSPRLNRFGFR